MQTALRMTTKVRTGGKLELVVPQVHAEKVVDVIILFPSDEPSSPKRSVMEILTETSGHRVFQTAAEVEHYLQKEHETWGV